MKDCEKYLGLRMVEGRSKVSSFKDLWKKIKKKSPRMEGKIYFESWT